MKKSVKWILVLLVIGFVTSVSTVIAGDHPSATTQVKKSATIEICTGCGEIKGSPKCCAPDAVKCGDCGLNKGSIGCCKDLKPAAGEKSVKLCRACGEVYGSADCCNPHAAKCEKCGRNKGAPGCCKDFDDDDLDGY